MEQQQAVGTSPATAQEVTALNGHQVVVFTSGGVVSAVAIRHRAHRDRTPCVVVDFDDRPGNQTVDEFTRTMLGVDRADFDREATYIW